MIKFQCVTYCMWYIFCVQKCMCFVNWMCFIWETLFKTILKLNYLILHLSCWFLVVNCW